MPMAALAKLQILLGISGGIAAYKSADLTRRLIEAGAEVRVVMTRAAQEFITPLSLQALSGHPVHTQLLDADAEAGMGHIALARWADLILIAPASADLLARLAHGLADDLLTTLCLASRAPLVLAPAMNQAMWRHGATQANVATLVKRGARILGPDEGSQACGDTGPGRMLEPLAIRAALEAQHALQQQVQQRLTGKKVVITAGPTREAIDPVRYLSNHSSGKMGYALAAAAAAAGADTWLISGPCALPTPAGVQRINVISAQEMLDATLAACIHSDIFIAAAAVADFRPAQASQQKIKKEPGQSAAILELVPNPDILAQVSALPSRPYCVGFAAETQDVVANARLKLQRKQLDLMIANDVSATDIGFGSDDNAVTLIDATTTTTLDKRSKTQLAADLIARIAAAAVHQQNPSPY